MTTRGIIELLNMKRPTADWIRRHSGLPYLPLDIEVPTEAILEEWMGVQHRSVPHRDRDDPTGTGNLGWRALTLHGVAPDVTQHTERPHAWTEVAHHCPRTRRFLEQEFHITDNDATKRVRFMWLAPGGHILPHRDHDRPGLAPVNIAITNPAGCEFRMMNHGRVPFRAGRAIMMDLSNHHWVVNDSDEPRLHIIFHGVVPDATVERSYANSRY